MKKRITAIILIAALAVTMLLGTAVAEPDGSLSAEAIESLKEEYASANVVVDIYRLAVYGSNGYQLESAYDSELSLTEKDLTKTEDLTVLAQEAAKITLSEDAGIEPQVSGAKLDEPVEDLLLGLYLLVPHGLDLSLKDYVKTTGKGEDEQIVSIARTDTDEYRFLPVIVAMNYDNTSPKTEIKAEKVGREGKLQIQKTATSYRAGHAATFVYALYITDRDGKESTEYISLTLDGTGSGSVVAEHLPIGSTVAVEEVYSGADLKQASGTNPDTVEITADSIENPIQVSFVNTYDPVEREGYGFTNTFERNENSWDWYQDGELMTGSTGTGE